MMNLIIINLYTTPEPRGVSFRANDGDSHDSQEERNFKVAQQYTRELQALVDEWDRIPYGRTTDYPELRQKIRLLAMKVHPDRNEGNQYLEIISRLINELFEGFRRPESLAGRQKTYYLDKMSELRRMFRIEDPAPGANQAGAQSGFRDTTGSPHGGDYGWGSWYGDSRAGGDTTSQQSSSSYHRETYSEPEPEEDWDEEDSEEFETLPYETEEFRIETLAGKRSLLLK